MKIYKVGDKSKGLCEQCKKLVSTTFKIKEVPLSSGKKKVSDLLVAVCDRCEHVVSIPQQSSIRIKETLAKDKKPLEVRVPQHLLDVLYVTSASFGIGSPGMLKDVLIRYYITSASKNKRILKSIKALSTSEFTKGAANTRISLKLNEALSKEFNRLINEANLTQTQFIKGLIALINKSILEEKAQSSKLRDEIEKVFLASA